MTDSMWLELEWLQNAQTLLQWVRTLEPKKKVILFVRHSHRLHSDDPHELLHMQLTPLGHEMAREFGKQLPDRGTLEIFYSKHPRCVETSEEILEGYKSNNHPAVMQGAIRELLGPKVYTSIGKELEELGIDGFINKWAEGSFPLSQIETLEEYGIRLWKNTVGELYSFKRGSFQVHVSHDLVLMSMRKAILGIEATEKNWIPFLGGFGIIKCDDSYQWFERNETFEINIE